MKKENEKEFNKESIKQTLTDLLKILNLDKKNKNNQEKILRACDMLIDLENISVRASGIVKKNKTRIRSNTKDYILNFINKYLEKDETELHSIYEIAEFFFSKRMRKGIDIGYIGQLLTIHGFYVYRAWKRPNEYGCKFKTTTKTTTKE